MKVTSAESSLTSNFSNLISAIGLKLFSVTAFLYTSEIKWFKICSLISFLNVFSITDAGTFPGLNPSTLASLKWVKTCFFMLTKSSPFNTAITSYVVSFNFFTVVILLYSS